MNFTHILSLDPSGNFHEGKGTTGWCIFDVQEDKIHRASAISAKDYDTMEAYWHAHILLINDIARKRPGKVVVVIEDYLLYATKANNQINSKMETPKLIGVLQHYLWGKRVPYCMQNASEVKTRWDDDILVHKGYLALRGIKYRAHRLPGEDVLLNKHCRDAIRHAVHYATFKIKGGNK